MNKIVIIGLGFVGKAYAYSLINQNEIDELVLIDTNENTLIGNYIDLKDASVLSSVNVKIGTYEDCKDAKIVAICAGKNQNKDETRLDLLEKNKDIIKSVTEKVVNAKFKGIFLVATNPVDICTYLVYKYSNFKKEKVIGSGTLLDTLRLKNILSEKFNVNHNDINTFVLGEHGDSSFPVWSNTTVKGNIIDLTKEEKDKIENEVHNIGYEIIYKKGETSYGIGRVLSYLTDIIINNKNKEITLSSVEEDLAISNLYILNKDGLIRSRKITLNEEEQDKFNKSKQILKKAILSLEE